MKVLICIGTRPEAIKMAPVCHELKKRNIPFRIISTGQHREMLAPIFDFFQFQPDYDMEIMQSGQSLNMIASRILSKADEILDAEKPDVLLVQGDTTSAAIVSLAAFNKKIPVAHVEAGLRTFDKAAPYPEELNRQMIARIADLHFAPTQSAIDNLIRENIPENTTRLVGNTIVDALHWALNKIKLKEVSIDEHLNDLIDPEKDLILVTGHRRENFGHGLMEICEAIKELSKRDNTQIIYPVHLNPNVKGPVYDQLGNMENIHLVEPVSYPEMIWLMNRAKLIISDSGGIQEEAPSFKTPVIVTRDLTERMEVVEAGLAVLTGADKNKIVAESHKYLKPDDPFSDIENPYGDGTAAIKIIDELSLFCSGKD
ncbi:non-hydrolyzing UDP-N-acetylglucosamine 2-epimerase [Christiangramia crocea]|uniref:UDP-N-acetylglucosamine 2-epimerase (non-hydrolyzing) n=1 Tax=Christiangramia crocea TaxID=2904124 RepID=A0A9X1UZB4_9FLAO|nr:UDP-N-acetylglucosamine 2-epimerase (non-hydrolyzing) [Gramella crocea]MCG9973029.1 UDP-N-acetylglucosamine 2-epimerase (non-hydrolyzing) [Gramella crocea]